MTPILYSEIYDKCGEPGDLYDMVKKPFPFTLYLNGDKSLPCVNFYGNKRIYPAVFEAFSEIMDYYGLDFIRKNGLDNYGGCYELRQSRSGGRMSVHSWGMAIDYLPGLGRFGEPALTPYPIVQIFRDKGFQWGGDWSKPDGMHFSGVIE